MAQRFTAQQLLYAVKYWSNCQLLKEEDVENSSFENMVEITNMSYAKCTWEMEYTSLYPFVAVIKISGEFYFIVALTSPSMLEIDMTRKCNNDWR